MRISVIGTGYVGLVSGVCLAEKGHHVICVDIDQNKVDSINKGVSPIFEKGLNKLLRKNLGERFSATTNLDTAVRTTELSMLAVGTPFNGETIDLQYIEQAAGDIGQALQLKEGYHTVIVKSTVVPGTTDGVVRQALERSSGRQAGDGFGLGMNPEFLREGEAVADFMHPDRIVLGGIDAQTHDTMRRLFAPFNGAETVLTANRTAEMIKYASNALLASMISFSNEIGNLCATIDGVDIMDVMQGVHLDKRISPMLPNGERITPGLTSYLEAGCGFGGSCFPKDVKALIAHGKQAGVSMPILDAVMSTNKTQPLRLVTLLEEKLGDIQGKRVTVLGLAFKPGTDDVRESPALPVIDELIRKNAIVTAYDPEAMHEARLHLNGQAVRYADTLASAVNEADAIVLVTRWPEFSSLPYLVEQRSHQPLVIDGRRMFRPVDFHRYAGIGIRP